ncbi:hypothetical protein XELAEV_18044361mg [Xenopus laevis]|uniref:RRM domain-containing protein n=1 Tax=Xenopus laevis TaxID=8355 RepID=A0A974BYN5_XENLA|nr:hypothetical protein XELAEV_18044361mg [Xenopus laevis]
MAVESGPSESLLSLNPKLQMDFQQKMHEIRRKRSFLGCFGWADTGNSKGYAHVEFECNEVAKIVADE